MENSTTINQLLFQATELTVKLNVLTSMVMGVYSETLPQENFLKIAQNFSSELHKQMNDAYETLQKHPSLQQDYAMVLQHKIDALLSIQQMAKHNWNLDV